MKGLPENHYFFAREGTKNKSEGYSDKRECSLEFPTSLFLDTPWSPTHPVIAV